MSHPTVGFALETTTGTTFYVSSGDSQCIEDKDFPTGFSRFTPATGYATRKPTGDCLTEDSHIHLYIWTDEDHTDQVVDFKFHVNYNSSTWHLEEESASGEFSVTPTKLETNKYQIVISD